MANFPSFSLTLEEKSSIVADVDALVAEAHDMLALTPNPTRWDYDEALRLLEIEATMPAKDCLQYDEEEEEEDDEDGSGPSSSLTKAYRRRSLNRSLAEASVLRGDILRTLSRILEARAAYIEVISRYPDDFPSPDAHAALTLSSSRRPSLIPRPSSSPAPSLATPTMTAKRSVRRHHKAVQPPNAATRAWIALLELSNQDSTTSASDVPAANTTRRNSTPIHNNNNNNNNHAIMSKREKRRAGVWSAGIYEPDAPMAETREESLLHQHMERLSCCVPIQDVGARKQVSIVERSDGSASDSSASSAARSDRSIQHKTKYRDLKTLRSQAQVGTLSWNKA